MLVPLSWLQEYVDISGISVDDLQKKMSSAGLSVERKRVVGEGLNSIVIGEISSQKSHPDSDHLWICTVRISENDSTQIVTGAQNIFEGAKVPVILAGNSLPDGTKIEGTVLRGVESHGMMCSIRELGLGEEHEGIMILNSDAPIGAKISDYLQLPDVIFDVEITANRGDCLSVLGIAREVATLLGRQVKNPEISALSSDIQSSNSPQVQIELPEKCNRFAAVGFEGFQLGTSPDWMQQRLLRSGMRPINNLVDISNYVMLEIGQPTHAYDASLISGNTFIVRSARPDEMLRTLDGKDFKLSEDTLVIADPEKSLGIAGVMGGESSKITSETHSLLLEVANFDPVTIRRTGIKLGIRTDAILRFERGVDSTLVDFALNRVNHLLHKLTGAHQSTLVVDSYPIKSQEIEVSLRSRILDTYLGTHISLDQAISILTSLGFELASQTGDTIEWSITVTVPSWRTRDVSIEEDLIEEVARIYGYDNIPSSTPRGSIPFVSENKRLHVKKSVLGTMQGLGFQEVLTYSFSSAAQLDQSGYQSSEAIEMVAPLSEEHRYMRMSLLPSLLAVVKKNEFLDKKLQLFELSSVYHRNLFTFLPDEAVSLALEPVYLSGVLNYKQYTFDAAFQMIASSFSSLFKSLSISSVRYVQDAEPIAASRSYKMFHPGRVAGLYLGDVFIGLFGEIHPALAESLQLKNGTFMFDFAFEPIVVAASLVKSFSQFSLFPATTMSLSVAMDEHTQLGSVINMVRALDPRIVSVSVGNVYRDAELGENKKSHTITFVLQSMSGVVTEQDSRSLRDMVIETLTAQNGITLRS